MIFFKGKVISDEWPYKVKDIETSSVYPDCQITKRGGQSWRPEEGDYVLCSVDENEFCLIMDEIQSEKSDSPATGTQLGDNENGAYVSKDGSVVMFKVDINSIRFTEEGVFLNYEALDEKGNGYIRRIKKADKDGAQSMETNVYEELKAPSQDGMAYSQETKGTGAATGTIERTTKMADTTGTKYEESLDSTGNQIIKAFSTFLFGEGATEPMTMGNRWKSFADAFVTLFDGHLHGSPAGPSGPPTILATSNSTLAPTEEGASTGTGAVLSTKVRVKE